MKRKERDTHLSYLLDRLVELPLLPGVYWFSDANDNVLYVGKAKILKNRVSSYAQLNRLNFRIRKMVSSATKIQWKVVSSELEALLVEAELIKTYQPEFNILLKDDKSSLYVAITNKTTISQVPTVITLRKQDISLALSRSQIAGKNIFGPFQSAYKVRQVLKAIRPVFQWCSSKRVGQPCFYSSISLCSGYCVQTFSLEKYEDSLHRLSLFLRGKTAEVRTLMLQKIQQYTDQLEYENAKDIHDQLQILNEILSPRSIRTRNLSLPQLQVGTRDELTHLRRFLSVQFHLPRQYMVHRIEGYDVSNLQGSDPYISMVTFIDGEKDAREYRVFRSRLAEKPNDVGMLKEALQRRQRHPEWGYPDLVLIDGGKGQLRAAHSVWSWKCPMISLAKDPDRCVLFKPDGTCTLIPLDTTSFGKMLQRVRDEAHRFAKKHHTRRRDASILDL